jgi:hypothetical protein
MEKNLDTLGHYLNQSLRGAVNKGECPTPKQIHQLVNGKLPVGEKREILQHIYSCDEVRCIGYIQFLDSVETFADNEKTTKRNNRRYATYVIPSLAAAAAIMFIVFAFIPQQPSFSSMYTSLTAHTKAKELAKIINIESDSPLAFSANKSYTNVKFAVLAGAFICAIKVMDEIGDKENASDAKSTLYDYIENSPKVGSKIKKVDSVDELEEELTELFEKKEVYYYFLLGEWIFLANMALETGNAEFVTQKHSRFFLEGGLEQGLPPGVIQALEKIDTIVRDNKPGEQMKRDSLEIEIDEIIKILL